MKSKNKGFAEASQQQVAGHLSHRAMLVSLKISVWTARKHDKKVSDEVADRHSASRDAGAYHKALVAKGAMEKVTSAASAARQFHYENSLPWIDEGTRILPAANFIAYSNRMRELKEEFDDAAAEFCRAFPAVVEQARRSLNGLFNAKDYPRNIADKFSMGTRFLPLPAGDDFRVDIGAETVDKIRAQIEATAQEACKEAIGDLFERVHHVVEKMSEKLKAYTVNADGKVENAFRDSLVTNVQDLLSLLPRLNFTGDPALTAMCERVAKTLAGYSPEELRASDKTRAKAIAEADAILDALEGYVS